MPADFDFDALNVNSWPVSASRAGSAVDGQPGQHVAGAFPALLPANFLPASSNVSSGVGLALSPGQGIPAAFGGPTPGAAGACGGAVPPALGLGSSLFNISANTVGGSTPFFGLPLAAYGQTAANQVRRLQRCMHAQRQPVSAVHPLLAVTSASACGASYA
jgi:hypothetical protein